MFKFLKVLARQQAKSIGCSKNFRGKQALDTIKKVEYWIKNLYEELEERLEDDKTIVIMILYNFYINIIIIRIKLI